MRLTLISAVFFALGGQAVAATLTGPAEVRVGAPATFTIIGLAPTAPVTLNAAPTLNRGGNCCGVRLGQGTADAAGTAVLTVIWPATYAFCGGISHCSRYPWLAANADVYTGEDDGTELIEVGVDPAAGGQVRAGSVTPIGRKIVSLGTRVAVMFTRWGRVDDYRDPELGGIAVYPFGMNATVDLKRGRLKEFTLYEGPWTTSRGITLGSTRTALAAAYGKTLHRVRYRGRKFVTRYHYYIQSGPNAIAFAMSRGKVNWIIVRPVKGVRVFLADQVGPI